jgi:hypothetical protein
MAYKSLTRSQALELITPIVDGEASEDEELAFYAYAQRDPSILKILQNERQLKRIIRSKCKRAAAPPKLRNWCLKRDYKNQHSQECTQHRSVPDANSNFPQIDLHPNPLIQFQQRTWVFATLAAAVLLIVLYGFVINWNGGVEPIPSHVNTASINISQQAYSHFTKSAGSLIDPTFSTDRHTVAAKWLHDNMEMNVAIPEIANASFRGVYVSDFDKDYKTPLLEYQTEAGDYIYLFVFSEQQLAKHNRLKRTPQAVEACSTSTNYYIENVQGKHVVSWRWEDAWYSAVSNFDGHDLAKRIQTLAQR